MALWSCEYKSSKTWFERRAKGKKKIIMITVQLKDETQHTLTPAQYSLSEILSKKAAAQDAQTEDLLRRKLRQSTQPWSASADTFVAAWRQEIGLSAQEKLGISHVTALCEWSCLPASVASACPEGVAAQIWEFLKGSTYRVGYRFSGSPASFRLLLRFWEIPCPEKHVSITMFDHLPSVLTRASKDQKRSPVNLFEPFVRPYLEFVLSLSAEDLRQLSMLAVEFSVRPLLNLLAAAYAAHVSSMSFDHFCHTFGLRDPKYQEPVTQMISQLMASAPWKQEQKAVPPETG